MLGRTDVGIPALIPGISLHDELELLVGPADTATGPRTATLNPARVLGRADTLGSIEVGKLADLVVLDAIRSRTFATTQQIRAVIADGRVYRGRISIDYWTRSRG